MSSSRKNIFAWLILAASAVLIAGGLSVLRSQSLLGETDTVVEYSTAVATSIQETAIHVPTTDAAEQSNNSIEAADEYAVTNESVNDSYHYSSFIRILGVISLLIGCAACIAVLILLQQDEPLAGPDGTMILLVLSVLFRLYSWNYVIGLSLFIFVLFITLRELTGWVKHRFRITWLIGIRIAYWLTQLAYGRDIHHFRRSWSISRKGNL